MRANENEPQRLSNTNPPQSGMQLMLWVSRHYVLSQIEGRPLPDYVYAALASASAEAMLEPLQRTWITMAASTNSRIQLHQPCCGGASPHEQALIMAIRCLQSGEPERGYEASLMSVVPQTTARALRGDLSVIAGLIVQLDAWSMIESDEERLDNVIRFPENRRVALH